MKKKTNFKRIIIFIIISLILLSTGVFATTGLTLMYNNFTIEHGVGDVAGTIRKGELKSVFTERKDLSIVENSTEDDIDSTSRLDGKTLDELVVYEFGGLYRFYKNGTTKTLETGAPVDKKNVLLETLASQNRGSDPKNVGKDIKTIDDLLELLNSANPSNGSIYNSILSGYYRGKYALYYLPNVYCLYHGQAIGKYTASFSYWGIDKKITISYKNHATNNVDLPDITKDTPLGYLSGAEKTISDPDYFEYASNNPWRNTDVTLSGISSLISGINNNLENFEQEDSLEQDINRRMFETNMTSAMATEAELEVNNTEDTNSRFFEMVGATGDPWEVVIGNPGPYGNRYNRRTTRSFVTTSNVLYYLNSQSPDNATLVDLYNFNNGLVGDGAAEVVNSNTISYGVAFSAKSEFAESNVGKSGEKNGMGFWERAQADIWAEFGSDPYSSYVTCNHAKDYPNGTTAVSTETNPDVDPGYTVIGEGYSANELCLYKAGRALDLYEIDLAGSSSTANHEKAVEGTDSTLRNQAIVSTKNQSTGYTVSEAGHSKDATGTTVIMNSDGSYTQSLNFNLKDIDTEAIQTDSLTGSYFYKIGPFTMSDYSFAASKHVGCYSGTEASKYKDLIGGIVYGELTFTDEDGNNEVKVEIGRNEPNKTKAKIIYEDNSLYLGKSSLANEDDRSPFLRQIAIEKKNLTIGSKTYAYYSDYEYPRPDSTFFIVIPMETAGTNSAILSKINFLYRQSYSTGDGWVINSKYLNTVWKTDIDSDGCAADTYKCHYSLVTGASKGTWSWKYDGAKAEVKDSKCTIETDPAHKKGCPTHTEHGFDDGVITCAGTRGTLSGTIVTAVKHDDTCTTLCHCEGCTPPTTTPTKDSGRSGCYTVKETLISAGNPTADPPVEATYSYSWEHNCVTGESGCCNTKFVHKDCDNFSFCKHGYLYCKKTNGYSSKSYVVEGQPFLAVHKSRVALRDYYYVAEVKVRLTTDVKINKYIADVEHEPSDVLNASGLDTTLRTTEGDTRKDLDKTTKEDNQVYVEYGDIVTYNIELINSQNVDIDVKVKDILPEKCIFMSAKYTNGTNVELLELNDDGDTVVDQYFRTNWVHVPANDTTVIVVKIRVDSWEDQDNSGNIIKWKNEARIITTNEGYDGEDAPDHRDKAVTTVDYVRLHVPPQDLPGPVVNLAEIDDKEVLVNYDWYSLNNYNMFIDKYVYQYNEEINKENSIPQTGAGDLYKDAFTEDETITDTEKILNQDRKNNNTAKDDVSNGDILDKVRNPGTTETDKYNYPVSMEKEETFKYAIRISNEAETINTKTESSGIKRATQARPTKITDIMQKGLDQTDISAKLYRNGSDSDISVTSTLIGDVATDGKNFTHYEYTFENDVILNPGDYIIITVEVYISESNMYLYKLKNTAYITELTNINHQMVTDEDGATLDYFVQISPYGEEEERNENISKQQKSSEYIRMKDLVIAGKVWLDFNKNGLMDDTISDYIEQTKEESLYRESDGPDKLQNYYGINDNAMFKDIIVKLYKKGEDTPIRTTVTDENGFYTFGKKEDKSWNTLEYTFSVAGTTFSTNYSGNNTYQRVDKATDKDTYGNYQEGTSEYIEYFVEYEYDGVLFKATAYSGKDHLNDDGSYDGSECNHSFETNTSIYATDNYESEKRPSSKYKYEYDSNANEFDSVRQEFNKGYEYITYDRAYDVSYNSSTNRYGESTTELDFDKTNHTSQLKVNHKRAMRARTFIERIGLPDEDTSTEYIPLFGYSDSDYEVPYTRYLKFINLGLELREDADISLTKDVYKVKTTIKGEEMEYNYNQNFIMNGGILDQTLENNYKLNKPYGIELYESDYKYRMNQYATIDAVKDYYGETSELNVEVTYRIRIDNNRTPIDGDLKDPSELTGSYDEKNFKEIEEKTELDVKIDEVLDLYDENFIKYTPEMENHTENDYIEVRQMDPYTGRFSESDKQIKIAEAWYYEPSESGTYVLDDTTQIYVNTEEESMTVAEGTQKYKKVDLTVSNTSKKTDKLNEYLYAEGKLANDGYNKLYITGMHDATIKEGEHLDLFVKYVLDKDNEEIAITNESLEETVTKESSTLYSAATYDPTTDTVTWSWNSTSTVITYTDKVTNLIRSLIVREKRETNPYKKDSRVTTTEGGALNLLGTENIAQINMYSVWYQDGSPTSIVDKDSNAGNVAIIDNDKTIDSEKSSVDNIDYYEDNVYRTGINISCEGTANIPEHIEDEKIIPDGDTGSITRNITRVLSGHVWDDSRSEKAGTAEQLESGIPEQFIGNGIRKLAVSDDDTTADKALEKARKNELVPIMKNNKTEERDIPVSSIRAEFIEIVETAANTYYEIKPTDIGCKYLQHIRTDENGEYKLYGYTPGKYVVRFTYGDDIETSRENGFKEQTNAGIQALQDDMYLFNGQDYKSTKYTTPGLSEGTVLDDALVLYNHTNSQNEKEILRLNEEKIDSIINSLERETFNDARDDEIRRLEVNGYSEIINNMIAEILQGKANGITRSSDAGATDYLTNNTDANTDVELKALIDNTWMFSETVPFTVRAEKVDDLLKAAITPITSDPTYGNREQLEKQLTYLREFSIKNVDFGIEYRPENSVQLEKEIKEIKVVTESEETVIDLHFYTDYENTENASEKTHYIDMKNSVGLEMIQFISNEYENELVSGLITEKGGEDAFQGFVYINYDVDIQQGATIEVTYEFIAENHGEVDRISRNLDDIRYQNNYATEQIADGTNDKANYKQNLITGTNSLNGVTNYRANLSAANEMTNNMYARDSEGVIYRKSPKVLTATEGQRAPTEVVDSHGASRNKLSYYGYYVGYTFYTGEVKDFDTIAQIRFNKILDYVDKDMHYLDNTKGNQTLNKTWSVLDNTYEQYYTSIDWARSDPEYVAAIPDKYKSVGSANTTPTFNETDIINYVNKKINDLNLTSIYSAMEDTLTGNLMFNPEIGKISGASIDPEGYIYDNMLISTDTGMYTDKYIDENRTLAGEKAGTNPSLSRFLVPTIADLSTDKDSSRGKIDLTVSKSISAETGDDELEYENIAEVVEYTTLTGRRTNFAITIGNVDVRKPDPSAPPSPITPVGGPQDPNKEYPQATPEPDQAAAEVITLIPPQGLMKRDRVIKDIVEIAKTGTSIVGTIVAVVVVAIAITLFAIRKYRKRRIK